MDKNSRKTNRWRLRFSIRTMLLVSLLVGIYFALGAPTRTLGVRDVGRRLTRENDGGRVMPEYTAPLILQRTVYHLEIQTNGRSHLVSRKSYYFWFFGLTAELPWQSQQIHQLPADQGIMISSAT